MEQKKEWILRCPEPRCGKLVPGYYNAGPMLADDREGPTAADSAMQVVTGVSAGDFQQYAADLKSLGIRISWEHTLGADAFFGFSQDERQYHVSFLASRGEMRFIEDVGCASPEDFGYVIRGDTETIVYQYGLYYDPDNNVTDTTVNCGMLYIIRLSDNSLFVMDGGHIRQWNTQAADALWDFLRRITGTQSGGTIRISGWYCTHAHDDHMEGLYKLLNHHHHEIQLERVFFNFPAYGSPSYSLSTFRLKEAILRWYPQVKTLKPHTGQKFSLCDMDIAVLYAHEDAVEIEDLSRFPLQDFNCTSTILRVTIRGCTLMLLGDTNVETEAFLVRHSYPALWKADMVQVAHHCFNFLDTLYAWIGAPMAMVPNSWGGAHQPENIAKLAGVEAHLKGNSIFYEGGGTDGFIPCEGGWKHVFHEPLTGGEYDYSGF